MKVNIVTIEGKKTGRSIDLPDEIFGIEPNTHVVYLAVKQYLAAQRQGTHKVKTRAEVQGQAGNFIVRKEQEEAVKGNLRNPLYKGGGTVFGPKPHGYDFKLNRKVKDLAKMSALSSKAKDNALVVVEDINFDVPKTNKVMGLLNSLDVAAKKILFVIPEYNDNLYLSLRNVPSIKGSLLSDINTYDIVDADVLVLTEGAAKIFVEEEEETKDSKLSPVK